MRWSVLAVLFGFASPALAADAARLVGENRRTAQRFAEAAGFEREQRWAAAIDLYLRIIDENGDDLIAADAAGLPFSPARWLAQRRIAARPELVGPYRERVESQARALLERGRAQRDPGPLEQLVGSYFCSRSAEEALHLLGDLACEQGDFPAARRYWGMLVRAPGSIAIPDPQGDPALPHAKMIVARLLNGERAAASAELAAFAAKYPTATGKLAGRDGLYVSTLKALLADPDLAVARGVRRTTDLRTYAVDATRNGVARDAPPSLPERRCPPILLPDALPRSELRVEQRAPIRAGDLAIHPLVCRGHAFVADARRLSAYDLASGKLAGQFVLKPAAGDLPRLDLRSPTESDARYTLTAAGDRIYARFGAARFRSDLNVSESFLVALQLRPAADDKLQVRWQLSATRADQPGQRLFDGAPVVHEERLYVAITRSDGNRLMTAVACYDPTDPLPQLVWQQDVLETGPDSASGARNLLLTAAGPLIFVGPHWGAIVALSAATGQRVWAARYAPGAISSTRGLCPCIAVDGRVFAAPSDYDRLLAFDAATGTRLWESETIDASHVLGVAGSKLIVQIGGATAGLCALDPATGRHLPNWGYLVFGNDPAAPFGRGLLFEDRVYWPTRAAGVRVARLDGTPEYPAAALQELPGGNLAFGDDWLIVATRDRLHVLGSSQPTERRIDALRRDSRDPHFKIGRSQLP